MNKSDEQHVLERLKTQLNDQGGPNDYPYTGLFAHLGSLAYTAESVSGNIKVSIGWDERMKTLMTRLHEYQTYIAQLQEVGNDLQIVIDDWEKQRKEYKPPPKGDESLQEQQALRSLNIFL